MFDNKQYWEKRLKGQYDLQGVGFSDLSNNYNKWSYKVTEKVLKRLFKKYAPRNNDQVLDVGSGTGFVVGVWKQLNKRITGIDITRTAVENLSLRYPQDKFLEFDIGKGKVDLPDNIYGCASSASVLYHIVDDDGLDIALQNVHRLLVKGGVFIFSDNFPHNKAFEVEHQKCRTLDEYERLLKKNNFEIIDRVPNYVLMNTPLDDKGFKYRWLWNKNLAMCRKSRLYDSLIWKLLYPVELFLVSVMKESPAQEFMICKAIK